MSFTASFFSFCQWGIARLAQIIFEPNANLLPGVDGRTWRFNSFCTAQLERGEAPGWRRLVSLLIVSFSLFSFERMRKTSKIASAEEVREGV